MTKARSWVAALLAAGGITAVAVAVAVAADMAPSTAEGVFTEEQATRGERIYDNTCAACHGGNMRGTPGAPGIIGIRFEIKWTNKPASELFGFIQDTMPKGNEGSLTSEEYADVLAHILATSGYPPHPERRLPNERAALEQIMIVEQ
jgi:mono/diheme cytochrome c family protein